MEYQIISSKGDKVTLCIDSDMTVGDVKGIAAAMLDAPEDVAMTMSFNGKQLKDDEETWGEICGRLFHTQQLHPMQRKLFCNVTDRPVLEAQSSEMLRMLPSKEEKKMEEEKERQKIEAMDTMIDYMVANPVLVENILSMNPMVKKMQDKSPEVARMLKDPDTLRMLLKSSVDPQRRREMERNAELQLAHISALPGGQQMINHYMDQISEDAEETVSPQQPRGSTSATEESSDFNHPDPTKEANNDPLPNPWVSTSSNEMPPLPSGGWSLDGGGFPFANSLGYPPAAFSSPGASSNPMASFFGGGAVATPSSEENQASTNAMMDAMMQMMARAPSGLDSTTTEAASLLHDSAVPPPPASPSLLTEEVMQKGLSALCEMGFDDEALCREALAASGGDVEAAVDYIADHQRG